MTYGLDQCRVCGITIPYVGPAVAKKQEAANRRPILEEKEWRRRGYLASPTRSQLGGAPAEGCCRDCGLHEMQRAFKYRVRMFVMAGFFLVITMFVVWVVTFLPH